MADRRAIVLTLCALLASGAHAQVTAHTFNGVWWFGDVLRFDDGAYATPPGKPGKFVERTDAWSLNDDGHLTIQITRATEERETRVTLVYAKQPK